MLALALGRATAMARVPAGLPAGVRLTDHISLGVIARTFPIEEVRRVLAETGKASERQRDLPAQVMVYYAIALALHTGAGTREVLRCLLEGLRWLWGAEAVRVAGRSGISQARTRLGEAPLRRLYEQVVRPVATSATKGAWYRRWRLVSLDGSCLDLADTDGNCRAFGRPEASRGESAFPQLRFVALVENGTHVLFGTCLGRYEDGETTLARGALPALRPGMLCLAGVPAVLRPRAVAGGGRHRRRPALAGEAQPAAAARGGAGRRLLPDHRLPDGEGPAAPGRGRPGSGGRVPAGGHRRRRAALPPGDDDPGPRPGAPAADLAALYHERWEIEGALAELKTHLRGARVVLRSKTPELVRQEFWGLLLAHFAVRGLMHEAALRAGEDPDRLSFLHAVRVVRRKLPLFVALSPSGQARPA